MTVLGRMIYLFFIIIMISACSGGDAEREADIESEVSLLPTAEQLEAMRRDSLMAYHSSKFPKIGYTKLRLETDSAYRVIRDKFGKRRKDPIAYKTFITLNRREFRYVRVGDSIIVPDTVVDDLCAYSVLPHYYPDADSIDKLIIVSNQYQCYAAYENGVLVRFAAANTGKEKTQTYPGRYSLVWKAKDRVSSLNSEWKLPFNFNFHRLAGNAFHQFAMPGRPVSHSCVRQFLDDAEWLYYWGEQANYIDGAPKPFTGTLVLIVDAFDFDRKQYGPWLDLPSNKFKIDYLPVEPLDYELPFIPISQVPKTSRGLITKDQKDRYKYALDTLYARGILREGVKIIPSIDYNKLREENERKAREKREAEAKAKEAEAEVEEVSTPDGEGGVPVL